MFVTNWISTTKIQKISEITNFFRHYFLSRTEVFPCIFQKKNVSLHKISEGDLQAKSGSFTTFRHFPIFSFPKNDINGLRRDCLYTDNLP